MAERNVHRWVEQFNEGRTTTQNNDRSGWLSTAINKETVNIMRTILIEDRCYKLNDFYQKMAIQYSYVECHRTILTNELEMRKVYACWVPRELSDLHRKERMGAALEFLTMYREVDALFDRIITGDKMLVHYWMPESKATSMQWKHKDEKALKKFKKTASTSKVMATVFWDWQGVLQGHFPGPHTKRFWVFQYWKS